MICGCSLILTSKMRCERKYIFYIEIFHPETVAFMEDLVTFSICYIKIIGLQITCKWLRKLKDTHREKAPSNKNSSAKEKYGYGHLGSGTSNQIWGSYTGTTFSNIKQELEAKRRSSWYVYFVLPILFVSALSSDWAVLYGNIAFSILVLSIKNRCSSFLEKVFLLQKIFYKVFITFKISSGRHLKTWWSLKWRAILKILSNLFWRIYALSYGFKRKLLK